MFLFIARMGGLTAVKRRFNHNFDFGKVLGRIGKSQGLEIKSQGLQFKS